MTNLIGQFPTVNVRLAQLKGAIAIDDTADKSTAILELLYMLNTPIEGMFCPRGLLVPVVVIALLDWWLLAVPTTQSSYWLSACISLPLPFTWVLSYIRTMCLSAWR